MFSIDDDGSLITERLVLRRWTDADREPFAAMNSDPRVMEHFPAPLTREQSDTMIDRMNAFLDEHGYGFWALQAGDELIGFTGLNNPRFRPGVEVAWRLLPHAWGHGYASEAARAAVAYGFERLGLDEIVSFTAKTNVRSMAVMRRIGMTYAGDFEHPDLPADHRLRPHVLYTIKPDTSGRG